MSEKLQYYLELTRIKKPIGYMLLFWPCSWGLTISYDFNTNLNLYLFYLFLFFSGSLLMRSAGCIINDVVDKNYDSKVKRTKYRPIAAKKVSVKEGLSLSMILCLIAFIVFTKRYSPLVLLSNEIILPNGPSKNKILFLLL